MYLLLMTNWVHKGQDSCILLNRPRSLRPRNDGMLDGGAGLRVPFVALQSAKEAEEHKPC
jgi:hypothetical protein